MYFSSVQLMSYITSQIYVYTDRLGAHILISDMKCLWFCLFALPSTSATDVGAVTTVSDVIFVVFTYKNVYHIWCGFTAKISSSNVENLLLYISLSPSLPRFISIA